MSDPTPSAASLHERVARVKYLLNRFPAAIPGSARPALRNLDTPEHRAFWEFIARSAVEGRRLLAETHPDFMESGAARPPHQEKSDV